MARRVSTTRIVEAMITITNIPGSVVDDAVIASARRALMPTALDLARLDCGSGLR